MSKIIRSHTTRGLSTLLPMFILFVPAIAKADGLLLFDSNGNFQDEYLLNNDPTAASLNAWGPGTNRAPFPIVDQQLEIVANNSDVHAYVFDKNRRHADNAADASSDIGGDGYDYQGGIEGFRCPKGNTCLWTLAGWANQGKSFIVQREFALTNGLLYLPLISNPFAIDNGTTRRAGIEDELKTAVNKAIIGDSSIKTISDETLSASWETGRAMCKREGLTTGGICGHPDTYDFVDLIRLHFDAHITPNTPSWCTTSADILDAATFGLDFGAFISVRDAFTGSYRGTADVWLLPLPGNSSNFYQFQVNEVYSAYSAKAYSGVGASTVVNHLQNSFEGSKPAVLLRNGFIMKVGQFLCSGTHDANWFATCTTDGVNENDLSTGVHFFQNAPPKRIQFGMDIDTGTTAVADDFPPLNDLAADGHAGLLDIELGR